MDCDEWVLRDPEDNILNFGRTHWRTVERRRFVLPAFRLMRALQRIIDQPLNPEGVDCAPFKDNKSSLPSFLLTVDDGIRLRYLVDANACKVIIRSCTFEDLQDLFSA